MSHLKKSLLSPFFLRLFKKTIPVIIICTLIISCKEKNKQYEGLMKVEQKEDMELAKGIRKDSIFLDLTFGMSEKEVKKKLGQLLKQGKIQKINNNYCYKFNFEFPKESIATFGGNFFNDSLYVFTLEFFENSNSLAKLVYSQMVLLLMDKYGNPIVVPNLLNEAEKDYYWIIGNQKIKVVSPFMSKLTVYYIDILAERKKETIEKLNQEKETKKVLNDL